MRSFLLLFGCLTFGVLPLCGQQRLIVELSDSTVLRPLLRDLSEWRPEALQRLIPGFEYWWLECPNESADGLLQALRRHPSVRLAQADHPVTLRSLTPNDPLYAQQWQYDNDGSNGGALNADLDAPEAWAITTGGTAAGGERIVVAVIDDGISLNHPDLYNNRRFNTQEIPGNNLDDDGNGYVDDYRGWNSTLGNDDVSGGSHGTSVAGIIGAEGNNNLGVTGVNWDVDMLVIRNNIHTSEAQVLAAYGYALVQRRLYNQTNGAKGALVVATNASWGINYGQPADAPLWCAFYDTLGSYGILNVGATANLNVNVDSVGDLPTACPSDFLVSVTNVNRLGNKLFSAAYGSQSIDLGAFGESVYTTVSGTGYGIFGGTSAAAPHVTGTIGLLYAAACPDFMALVKTNPAQAALLVKQWILGGVVPESTLSATVSGGRLNLHNSLQLCLNQCPTGCYPPYNPQAQAQDTVALLRWLRSTSVDSLALRYRTTEAGSPWSPVQHLPAVDSLLLSGLLPCTDYAVELWGFCSGQPGGDTLRWSFGTDGCCHAPSQVRTEQSEEQSLLAVWEPLLAARHYRLRYRQLSAPTWTQTDSITETFFWIHSLNPCTYYEWQVSALCLNGDTTEWTHVETALTTGCQSCALVQYCESRGQNATDDWIQRFSLGNFTHTSGKNGGYLLYDSVFIPVHQGGQYAVEVRQGAAFLEYVRLRADWNQDGDFDDAYELIFEGSIPYTASVSGWVNVPLDALPGITRLRVSLRWQAHAEACGTFAYGEVEDYCLQVIPSTGIEPTSSEEGLYLNVFPNPAAGGTCTVLLTGRNPQVSGVLRLYNALGQTLSEWLCAPGLQSMRLDLGAQPGGWYWLEYSDAAGRAGRGLVVE